MQEGDVVWHVQLVSGLVPASPVDSEHGMGAGRHVGADLGQVWVHHVGIGGGQDQGGSDAASRAYRAKQVSPGTALIAGRWGPGAALGPNSGQRALLADAGLVLPPELQRLAAGVLWQCCAYKGGEVALKDACAAAS